MKVVGPLESISDLLNIDYTVAICELHYKRFSVGYQLY